MRKAPWKDNKGNEIYEGDKVSHQHREEGVVHFMNTLGVEKDQWVVEYSSGGLPKLYSELGEEGVTKVQFNHSPLIVNKFKLFQTVVHKKGGEYKITQVPDARLLESCLEPFYEYQDIMGHQVWIRPKSNMEDGRFKPLDETTE